MRIAQFPLKPGGVFQSPGHKEVVMAHLVKKLVLAASAAALVAAPASARGGWGGGRGHHDGIDAGDVIAGALVIGGIAAIASAASNDRYRSGRSYGGRYDRGYDDDRGYYNNGYNSRQAVDQCVRAAQQEARRYGGGWARVTDVSSINRVRGGYEVRGRLVVENDRYRGNWRGGYDRYGYNYDRYGNDYDKGRFSCVTRYGGVDGVRVTGLRGGW